MAFVMNEAYPIGEPDVIDLGDGHFAMPFRTETTDCYLWWHHCPRARAWSFIAAFEPDQASGRIITSRDPLTVRGSLQCPSGCGEHGFIEAGRWRSA